MAYTSLPTVVTGEPLRDDYLTLLDANLEDHETRIAALATVGGNVVGQASSVDNELALFSGTGGKTIKRATTTGLVKATSGVIAAAVAGTDYSVPAGAETLTNKTLTAPVLTAPAVTSTGMVLTKSGIITELTGTGTYTVTIPIPAGAWIHDIKMTPQALWTAGTSAIGKVGDTADDDGFFIGIDMKATDLLLGEVLSVLESTLWGGKEGAYLNAGTGQRGPVATNFGLYYVAASSIKFAVVKTGAGTAGRTHCSVTYSLGEVIAQVVT